ncbi:MAG: isoamylase early set domain-containing protein [Chloroflexi bacterium]|nr:isoamylase early set domain-containing protein [Chloroflexota bacterium]MBI4315972.1 isoamylase early set domain-containing protein [Chloroflexota bacterium]MBI5291418.1 isoamylase early set domain-containing protein [Chloroflexota bacterium]
MIKKIYSETEPSWLVTFELPPEVNAQTACLCGEFDEWDETSHPMERREDGSFTLTLSLQPERRYRFRYLLDGERWENDWAADAYEPNPFGSEDSVVQL